MVHKETVCYDDYGPYKNVKVGKNPKLREKIELKRKKKSYFIAATTTSWNFVTTLWVRHEEKDKKS